MYNLMIQAHGNPSPFRFKFDKKEEAFSTAHKAMQEGYHRTKELALVLGAGSVVNFTSDEGEAKAMQAAKDAERSGGLIQDGRFEVKPSDFVLHIQMGMAQLPPLTYESEGQRSAAIDYALKKKVLHYVFEKDHDELFIMLGTGIALMNLSGETYIDMRRKAIALRQQQMARAQQQAAAQDPKILLPFGR